MSVRSLLAAAAAALALWRARIRKSNSVRTAMARKEDAEPARADLERQQRILASLHGHRWAIPPAVLHPERERVILVDAVSMLREVGRLRRARVVGIDLEFHRYRSYRGAHASRRCGAACCPSRHHHPAIGLRAQASHA